MRIINIVLAVLAALVAASPSSWAEQACEPAIAMAERQNTDFPAHLLHAIGMVEAGHRDPVSGRLVAWPWSVNVLGESHYFDTRDQAISFAQDAQARGIRSIDVGCMQVNLMYHPDAFASLEEAFTPEANVRFAASFLRELHQRTGDWMTAAGSYHSATPGTSEAYALRVRNALSNADADTYLPLARNPALVLPVTFTPQPVPSASAAATKSAPIDAGAPAWSTLSIWSSVKVPSSTDSMVSSAARNLPVIVPGAQFDRPGARQVVLRDPANLPRVFRP